MYKKCLKNGRLLAVLVIYVLASFSIGSIECTGCANVIKTYYECIYLNMSNSSGVFSPVGGNTSGNSLNDTFLGSQIDGLKLKHAMILYAQIYDASKCNSYTCDCIRSQIITSSADYSLLFQSMKGLEIMIGELNIDQEQNQLPQAELEAYYSGFTGGLSALGRFCTKFEFALSRNSFYINRLTNCETPVDELVISKNLTVLFIKL